MELGNMQQITIRDEAKGKTIREIVKLHSGYQVVIVFTDDTYLCLTGTTTHGGLPRIQFTTAVMK